MKAILITLCILAGVFCLLKYQEAQQAYESVESMGTFADVISGGTVSAIRLEAQQQMRNYRYGSIAGGILFIVLLFVDPSPRRPPQ